MSRSRRNWLLRVLTLAGILLGGWLLYRTASQYSLADIVSSLRAVSGSNILTCLGFAAASYTCLTFNDWLALRYVGRPFLIERRLLPPLSAWRWDIISDLRA